VQTSIAEELLQRDALDASDAAKSDLASGNVNEHVLSLLAALTERFRISVSLIKTGHPVGSHAPSGRENDHYFYRAFDVIAVDDVSIAEYPDAASAVAVGNYLLQLAGDARPARVMGPSAWLSALGPGDRTGFRDDEFATAIDTDHVHIGF
jgi:hypothetical protein